MTEVRTRREKFEDYYRECWLKQLKIDGVKNPMAREPTPQQKNGERTGQFGKMGGRQKLKLSKDAEIINRMLNQRMLMKDIAELMGISQQAVSQTKIRYGLPRSDEETTGVNQEK
jgi:hypothetical protein|tara:strand:+ start:109 stop:453 length:345 start_codon:yes stop_codon:yes gene_type:complete